MSKNFLKEQIGERVRDSMHLTFDIGRHIGYLQIEFSKFNKRLMTEGLERKAEDGPKENFLTSFHNLHGTVGKLQVQLSSLQKRLSIIIERLVDNHRLFRKAGKRDLREAYGCVGDVYEKLQIQSIELQHENAILTKMLQKNDISNINKTINSLDTTASSLKKLYSKLDSHTCLKIS